MFTEVATVTATETTSVFFTNVATVTEAYTSSVILETPTVVPPVVPPVEPVQPVEPVNSEFCESNNLFVSKQALSFSDATQLCANNGKRLVSSSIYNFYDIAASLSKCGVVDAWVKDWNGIDGKCLFFRTLDGKSGAINEFPFCGTPLHAICQ